MEEGLVEDLVYLVRCAVDDIDASANRVEAMDLDALYRVAERHMLESACDTALKRVGIRHEAFREARGKAIRKVSVMDIERSILFKRLDDAGIWYVPLKGCVLQDLYPSYGMRQMSDNDILFDASRADDVRDIMESLGFETVQFDFGPHDIYHKEPVCNFEMHRVLFGSTRKYYEYYKSVERLLVPDGDGTMGRHFRDEDFYAYMLAHEYKHFSEGGAGLRSVLDIYVFLTRKADSLDWGYLEGELEKLGIAGFESRNRSLALRLYGGEVLDADDEELLAYVVDSGAYGTLSHMVAWEVGQRGRMGYLLHRLFMPYESMAMLYPILRHAPVLLPVCWLARIGKALVHKRLSAFGEFDKILHTQTK